ncbi:hypothetical protein SLEP1_g40111 [Rubroshorea leprosula]|uniref:Uncharacterized protein n=1 Tax=Rubroshorea leprosula TaxID=152421 RepID=A0AAV5L3R7_9ROSI|nr:hypothetical protein SLEP1_g40111 [Rubroshorea leprosula]
MNRKTINCGLCQSPWNTIKQGELVLGVGSLSFGGLTTADRLPTRNKSRITFGKGLPRCKQIWPRWHSMLLLI